MDPVQSRPILDWLSNQFKSITDGLNEAAVKAMLLKALDAADLAADATTTPLDDLACRAAKWVVNNEWALIWAWGKRLMPAPTPAPEPQPEPIPVAASADPYADWSDEDLGQAVVGKVRGALVMAA